MGFHEFKEKIKSVKKSTWIFWGIMITFVIIGIALGIVAMYLCGYTLLSWLENFYPWVILIAAILLAIIATYFYWRYRKDK